MPMNNIDHIRHDIEEKIRTAQSLQDLESVRVLALGKKGKITELMKTLGAMNADERKIMGQALNTLKNEITDHLSARTRALEGKEMHARLERERVDVTLPARPQPRGHIHPTSHTIHRLIHIFTSMGFEMVQGHDIEDDWHNFTALNFPESHPAREMQDTFFLPDDPDAPERRTKKLLRTHTSPVQIRHMCANQTPPIRIISLGRVYRSDYDMTHTPVFHQMECLYVDKNIHMGHLKGCMRDFVRAYFEVDDLPLRFRPSFFPFVEPGAEADIGCIRQGNDFRIGRAENPQDQSWMEILGAGMVHPNVLRNCGIDPDIYQGFAFGVGIERITMLKYGICDLRPFFESDLRWLHHYGFDPVEALSF